MIRRATAADVPRILELVRHFYAVIPSAWTPYDHEQLTALAEFLLERGVIFLAESIPSSSDLNGSDGRPVVVGLLAGLAVPGVYSSEAVAEELIWWVEPEARETAAGLKLLRSFEAWAQGQGVAVIKMTSPATPEGYRIAKFLTRVGYLTVDVTHLKRLNDGGHLAGPGAPGRIPRE